MMFATLATPCFVIIASGVLGSSVAPANTTLSPNATEAFNSSPLSTTARLMNDTVTTENISTTTVPSPTPILVFNSTANYSDGHSSTIRSLSATENISVTVENQTETKNSYDELICDTSRTDARYLMELFYYCKSFNPVVSRRCMADAKVCIDKNRKMFKEKVDELLTFRKRPDDFVESKISVAIMRYFSPVLIIIGTVMNVLAFLVLTLTKLREMSSSVYLITLSVTDTLNLTLMLMREWIKALWEIDYRNVHVVLCKGGYFLAYYVSHLSAWLLVAVTVERLVTVYLPLRAKLICTRKKAGIVILIIILFFLLLDGYLLWFSGPYNEPGIENTTLCHEFTAPEQEFFRLKVWPWLDMSIGAILPFIILLTCNVLIIVNLTRAARWRKASNTGGSAKQDDNTNSMTIMLLAISFIFVLLTLPINIYFIMTSTQYVKKDFHHFAKLRLAHTITKQLFYVNCAINFLLYCTAGKRFRMELVNLFCGKKDSTAPSTRITYASRQSSNSGIALNNSSLKHYKTTNGEATKEHSEKI